MVPKDLEHTQSQISFINGAEVGFIDDTNAEGFVTFEPIMSLLANT